MKVTKSILSHLGIAVIGRFTHAQFRFALVGKFSQLIGYFEPPLEFDLLCSVGEAITQQETRFEYFP